jgi:UDPglucose--hexose-1-phosphate uridylyltransferase
MFSLNDTSHRRLNALTGEWVLVSPSRTQRPWQGQVEKSAVTEQPQYDPSCYLCPGNERAGGIRNPHYSSTFVFDNDYPALRPDSPETAINERDLIVAGSEAGICRVGCFSPRHDLTLPGMSMEEVCAVIDMWVDQWLDLGSRRTINYVQIFENRGAMMGASNPHPHCQIWGTASIPNEPTKESLAQYNYRSVHDRCLLCEYANYESVHEQRVVLANLSFTAVVPFWAAWPFETLIIPKRHVADVSELTVSERQELGRVLQSLTRSYDALFATPFPYSMGFHQQPTDNRQHSEWHLHAHFFPPLLRSASIRKFMVGFEMLGTPQRDITPESAAERLRELCNTL